MQLNKVYMADVNTFIDQVEDGSAKLIIADPPYNQHKCGWDSFESDEKYWQFMQSWLLKLYNKLADGGAVYLFNTAYNSAITVNLLKDSGLSFRNWITWYKKDGFSATRRKYVNMQETILFYTKGDKYTFNYDDIRVPYESAERIKHAAKKGILKNGRRWFPNPNGKLCGDVWAIPSQRHKEKDKGRVKPSRHPTIKPRQMIERMVLASSGPGDLVLDLFSGSGMTSVVAKELGRTFIGCEADSGYISMIAGEGIEVGKL